MMPTLPSMAALAAERPSLRRLSAAPARLWPLIVFFAC
jgi:hypothetical protein